MLLAFHAIKRSRSSRGALASRGARSATTTCATISMTTNAPTDISSTWNMKKFGCGASDHGGGMCSTNKRDTNTMVTSVIHALFSRNDIGYSVMFVVAELEGSK